MPLAMGNGTSKAMVKANGKKRSLAVRDFDYDFQYQEKPLKLVKREYDSDEESEDLSTRVKLVDRHRHTTKQVFVQSSGAWPHPMYNWLIDRQWSNLIIWIV